MTGTKVRSLLLCGLFTVALAPFSFGQTSDLTSARENLNVVPPAFQLRSLDLDQPSDQESLNQPQPQSQTQSGNPQDPSLEDLGLSPSEIKGDLQLQARLDKRTHMLKIHQRLGLITTIPMIATVATSFGAGGRATSTSDRWAHLALGSVTGDLYFTTA